MPDDLASLGSYRGQHSTPSSENPPLIRRATSPARLEDADGQYVVYVAGAAVHLFRLSDGRDVVVNEPTSAGPVHAQLERSGLYLSYNETYSRMTGRGAWCSSREPISNKP
jgi:hypothetical protein